MTISKLVGVFGSACCTSLKSSDTFVYSVVILRGVLLIVVLRTILRLPEIPHCDSACCLYCQRQGTSPKCKRQLRKLQLSPEEPLGVVWVPVARGVAPPTAVHYIIDARTMLPIHQRQFLVGVPSAFRIVFPDLRIVRHSTEFIQYIFVLGLHSWHNPLNPGQKRDKSISYHTAAIL